MKIGIDGRIFGLSEAGLGRYAQELVNHLLKIDTKNQYTLFSRKGLKKHFEGKRLKNLTVEETEVPHYSFKEQLFLPSLLSRSGCDLIHFPHFNVPLFYRRPYVVTIHDLIKHESRGLETTTRTPLVYWVKYLGYLLVVGLASRRAKKIIVPSRWVKKKIVAQLGVSPDKIVVIYEGVSEEFRKGGRSSRKGARGEKILERYQIKKPFLLSVGSIYPHKNIDALIEVIQRVNRSLAIRDRPAATLIVACARNVFWERLRTRIKKMKAEDFVCLAGFVPEEDLALLYEQAKAFIFPTLSEGFGLPGLEAMARGCLVACSDIPVLKEIYAEVPLYFDPFSVEDIAKKILTILDLNETDRQKRISQGFERVKRFSWEDCARETLKVYQEVENQIRRG